MSRSKAYNARRLMVVIEIPKPRRAVFDRSQARRARDCDVDGLVRWHLNIRRDDIAYGSKVIKEPRVRDEFPTSTQDLSEGEAKVFGKVVISYIGFNQNTCGIADLVLVKVIRHALGIGIPGTDASRPSTEVGRGLCPFSIGETALCEDTAGLVSAFDSIHVTVDIAH